MGKEMTDREKYYDKKDHLQFECPECSCCKLVEIMTASKVTSPIISVSNGGQLDYGHVVINDGEFSHYECEQCGYVIVDEEDGTIDDGVELANYLRHQAITSS